jgi:hypothetical protein
MGTIFDSYEPDPGDDLRGRLLDDPHRLAALFPLVEMTPAELRQRGMDPAQPTVQAVLAAIREAVDAHAELAELRAAVRDSGIVGMAWVDVDGEGVLQRVTPEDVARVEFEGDGGEPARLRAGLEDAAEAEHRRQTTDTLHADATDENLPETGFDGFHIDQNRAATPRPPVASAADYRRFAEAWMGERGLDLVAHVAVLGRRGRRTRADAVMAARLVECIAAAGHLGATTVAVGQALGVPQQRASELLRAALHPLQFALPEV